jgi:esterase FrsA
MGLSRGVFVACHVASRLSYLRTILGFAPLTRLGVAREMREIASNPADKNTDLIHLSPLLFDRTIRFYIGNHDTRVGTGECYHFIQSVVEQAFQNQIRSPQIELFITPSIGHMGHGTSKEIFHAGADWLTQKLL